MSGSYADPLAPRIAWDADTDAASYYRWQGFYYKSGAGSATNISSANAALLNDETAAATVDLGAGTFTYYIGIYNKDTLWDALAYFVVSDSGGTWDAVETSVDTTNGYDGTWTVRDATPDGAYTNAAVNPDYRDSAKAVASATEVKGIRFKKTVTVSNAGAKIYAMHVYGYPKAASASTAKLYEFWDPTADTRLAAAAADFGTVPRSSSADVRFRIKNLHSVTANNIVVSNETLTDDATHPNSGQFLFSIDNGATFSATVTISSINAGSISSVIIARRVQHVNSATGAWCGRWRAESDRPTYDQYAGFFYWYFGDTSSSAVATPHIWYITPTHAEVGDAITIVCTGAGTSQAALTGTIAFDATSGGTATSWTRVAGGANAVNSSRTIVASSNTADPEHNVIVVNVPSVSPPTSLVKVSTDA